MYVKIAVLPIGENTENERVETQIECGIVRDLGSVSGVSRKGGHGWGTGWVALARFKEAGFHGVADDVRPAAQPELVGDARAIGFDGLDAQKESIGRLLVGVSLGQQGEHFQL